MKRYNDSEADRREKRPRHEPRNDPAVLIDVIKSGQRCSRNFKDAWSTYCQNQGLIMLDPAKHNPELLESFLDSLGKSYLNNPIDNRTGKGKGKGGMKGGMKGGGNFESVHLNVIEFIKDGQRNDTEWQSQWNDWCAEKGDGMMNPNKHDPIFLIAFVFHFGLAKVVQMPWAGPHLGNLGQMAKPMLANIVKKGQSMSEDWRDEWTKFVESKTADGKTAMKDPKLHESGVLLEFFDTIAIPNYKESEWMHGLVTGAEPKN